MKKYKIHILVVMLIIVAALGTLLVQANDKSETGNNDIILNILEEARVSEITSLTFSVDVKNVSDQADVSVVFDEELPEKAIKKCTYQDKKLNIYIAGISELFENGATELKIGTVKVDNDTEGAKNIKVTLIPESVEFINEPMDTISYQNDEVELKGRIVEEPETPTDPDKEPETPTEPDRNEYGSAEDAKASLENLLNELNKLLSSDYTAESWNNLYNLMQQAQLMLDNGATKEELEDMLAKLEAAKNGLAKEEETTTPKPTQSGATDKNTASKTGDESNVMLWVILAAAAVAGAGVVLFLTRKKNK